MLPAHHPCPCCGYRTFSKPAGGTMQLCPVCAWEDAPGEAAYNNSNDVELIQGQRNFLASGACEDEFLSVVRQPLAEEARSENWMFFDELRLKIIADIEREFYDVKREGGTTLHQMGLIDDYVTDPQMLKAAEQKDPEASWQSIAPSKLARFSQSLVFLDNLGFRFYLPAFMRHGLVTSYPEIDNADFDGVLWSLDDGPDDSYRPDSFAMLTPGQKQAVASFLFFIAAFDESIQASYAIKGLKRGWDAFVPDLLKLATL